MGNCWTNHPTPTRAKNGKKLRIFTFAELKSASKNFRADGKLGEGGFGEVFKGWLPDGSGTIAVAIKRMKSDSLQGDKEWEAEINLLGPLSHPNLVKLLGYCHEDKELLLVYEFMHKGSLENHLFRSRSELSWETRLKIACGAAHGLSFLHGKNIIYRDIKAANILLDEFYNGKMSDFGLAKLGVAGKSHQTTEVMGTQGYAAPEYLEAGHLYVKSDVYGFGVVLLEMLTGLRAYDTNRQRGKQKLTDWIQQHIQSKRKLTCVMDSRLAGKYPSKDAFRIAQLAIKCLAKEVNQRPSMMEVLDELEMIRNKKDEIGE